MIVGLVDYGVGNLHSLVKALELGGARVRVETNPRLALAADALVLPGVGAFGPAATRLAAAASELRDALRAGFPALGICLGMQLLFEGSEESPGEGLGIFPGQVRRLRTRRVPHMGWNWVSARPDPLFAHRPLLSAYYANSYIAVPEEPGDVVATSDYDGVSFPAAVRRARTWGVQFHPEKSGLAGLDVIRAFLAQVRR
ncbi:MAG: imidazole glycerol phosphate synthase subunit HisH [Gemmatimonadetes bacterium]|nr:imidazole glycerol phosphate synthase subunit HisH [Gemmatimonadota bacterium]